MSSGSYKLFSAPPRDLGYSSPLRSYGGTAAGGQSVVGTSFTPQSRAVGLIENAGPNGNSGVMDSTVKSLPQSDRIGQLYQNYDSTQKADRSSLADYTKQLLATNPQAKESTDQESSAVGGYYNGDIQSHLDLLANHAAAANNSAVQRAIAQAGRSNALYRMANGDSSYADRNYADVAAGYANQNAVRDADLRRSNYLALLTGQQQNLGKRNTLLDSYLQRSLLPAQAAHSLLSPEENDLSSLGYLDSANTQYSMPTYTPPPVDPASSRFAQMLAASQAYQAAHPGRSRLDMLLGRTGASSPEPASPVVPAYDSYGRPQAQPLGPVWAPPQTPIQDGTFLPNPGGPVNIPIPRYY